MSTADTLRIDHIGPGGDGVIRTPEGIILIPHGLPGEETVREDGALRVIPSSPERAEPFCTSFGTCGGCAVQHMSLPLYARWKRDMVARALDKAGLAGPVRETIIAHGRGRRRAIIHVRFDGRGQPVAGFMEAKSHRLLALDDCPVLVPELTGAFRVARAVCAPLSRRNKPLDVQVTRTDSGLDVDIRGHGTPDPAERFALTEVAARLDLARLSIHKDIIVERRPPHVTVAGASLHLPPRSFMQATEEAEQTLARLALESLDRVKHVADLFCGVGPFAVAFASTAKVGAFDGDADAIGALQKSVRNRQGLKPVHAEARDLFRRPLLPQELNAFDAVVLDPPRAGAEAQMRQIASSKLRHVISISCDLGSFIRDGLILQTAGFRLEQVTPVDQFAWTRHIELVGTFRR